MERMKGLKGSLGWYVVVQSPQVQQCLSCVLLFLFMRDRVPIYSGTLSIIPIVGKGFGKIENQ